MWKKIGEFKVESDDGQIFTIYEYQEFINSGHHQESRSFIPGMKQLRTPDGKLVAEINGIYQIKGCGLKLRRIDNP